MTKKVAIIQSNFLPWKGYFDFIRKVNDFVFFDTCQYTKRDWRNRNKIKVCNGDPWISIPVKTKNKFNQKINETIVSDSNWASNIWNKIEYNYKKAPHYSYVKEKLYDGHMRNVSTQNLSEINQGLIKFICKEFLDISTNFHNSSDFNLNEDKNLRLIEITNKLNGTEYISGEAAKCYLDEKLFTNNQIKLTFMDYSSYPIYEQLHGEFNHFVSIIDLLVMKGSESKFYLKN